MTTTEDRTTAEGAESPGGDQAWHQTACILCSINCGIEVRLDGRRFARVRGDKSHPGSGGYTCEKALRLDHYQNVRRPPDHAAAPAGGRHVRGRRLGHRHRGGRRRPGPRPRHPRRRVDLLLRRRRPGEPPGRRLRPGPAGRRGLHLLVQRPGPGEDRRVLGRRPAVRPAPLPHHRRLRAGRGGGVRRQEPVAVPRLPPGPHGAQGDRQRPGPGHGRDRPPPHRDRRPWPTSTSRSAPAPTPGACPRCWRCWWRRAWSTRTSWPSTPTATPTWPRTCGPWTSPPPAPWPAWRSRWSGPRPHASPGPRSVSIFEDLGIQQAPHSTLNSYLEKLLYLLTGNFARPGTDEHPHPLRQPRRRRRTGRPRPGAGHAGHRGAHHHRAGAVHRHPRRDPHRPPGPLPGHDRGERQPGALAARLPPHAGGARRPGPGGGHRRGPDRDRPPRRLRAAGGIAVREVGGDLLQPGVPPQRLPPAAPRCSTPSPARCPNRRSTAGWCGPWAPTTTTTSGPSTTRRRRAGPPTPPRS